MWSRPYDRLNKCSIFVLRFTKLPKANHAAIMPSVFIYLPMTSKAKKTFWIQLLMSKLSSGQISGLRNCHKFLFFFASRKFYITSFLKYSNGIFTSLLFNNVFSCCHGSIKTSGCLTVRH